MAQIEQLRDGRSTGLVWPLLNGSTQQPTNQPMVSAECRALERRCEQADHVGEEVYSLFWVANRAMKKTEIERAIGPQISMASAGWEDATTNQKSTVLRLVGGPPFTLMVE